MFLITEIKDTETSIYPEIFELLCSRWNCSSFCWVCNTAESSPGTAKWIGNMLWFAKCPWGPWLYSLQGSHLYSLLVNGNSNITAWTGQYSAQQLVQRCNICYNRWWLEAGLFWPILQVKLFGFRFVFFSTFCHILIIKFAVLQRLLKDFLIRSGLFVTTNLLLRKMKEKPNYWVATCHPETFLHLGN